MTARMPRRGSPGIRSPARSVTRYGGRRRNDREDGTGVVTAHRYTDSRIDCDHPAGCFQFEFASRLELVDATAAAARKILKARGWAVSVPGEDGSRRDYCPAHKPGASAAMAADKED